MCRQEENIFIQSLFKRVVVIIVITVILNFFTDVFDSAEGIHIVGFMFFLLFLADCRTRIKLFPCEKKKGIYLFFIVF